MYSCTSSDSRILVRGGNIGQKFIHEFHLSPVLQWRSQNFGSGGHSAKMYSSKTFEKILKVYKKFAQNFKKILRNFSLKYLIVFLKNLTHNKIKENLLKFKKFLDNLIKFKKI